MSTKYVYTFGDGKAEGKADMKNLLGGKGANLAEMNLIGVPVPAGFTITTEVCTLYNQEGKDAVVKLIENDVKAGIAATEKLMNAKFGSKGEAFPLLVSVRSGARVSMPGMMDTVLNLGMNDDAVKIVAEKSGNARFPDLPVGAIMGSHLRRVRFMDDGARRSVPPVESNPGRMGNSGECSSYGLRKHG